MGIKIENSATVEMPRQAIPTIEKIFDAAPASHLRGIERLRIVDQIKDPRIPVAQRTTLPGLYHPKQGNYPAWLELAAGPLFPSTLPLHKRLMLRFTFKGNVAAVLYSLIGQHYYMTMRHSMKKNQLEGAVRAYTETQLRNWSSNEKGWRAKLFGPLQPRLEKWSRALQKRAREEKKKKG
jgi:hypothetical protein